MEAYGRVAHVALNLLLWCQGCDRVDDDDVDGCRAYQLVSNLECLLAIVWLRDKQVVDVDTQFGSIEAVEGVLSIDEGCNASVLLCLGNGMDGQRGLTTRLRSVYLDDTSLGIASYAECGIQSYGTCGYDVYILYFFIAHAHDTAFAEVFLYLRQGCLQRFHFLLLRGQLLFVFFFFCHNDTFSGVDYFCKVTTIPLTDKEKRGKNAVF